MERRSIGRPLPSQSARRSRGRGCPRCGNGRMKPGEVAEAKLAYHQCMDCNHVAAACPTCGKAMRGRPAAVRFGSGVATTVRDRIRLTCSSPKCKQPAIVIETPFLSMRPF